MTRNEILENAARIVSGDRDKQYGNPENSFTEIGSLWSAYLGREVTPLDVAIMMSLMKIARIKTGNFKEDSYIDACGYLACGGEIASKENTPTDDRADW